MTFAARGHIVLPVSDAVRLWARAAAESARLITADPGQRARWLRHGGSWFVGVDALDNAPDGSVGGVPLTGPWEALVPVPERWHRAQLSVVYPGYPGRDPDETDAAHAFRRQRFAAHLDGLLPVGPRRRRMLVEPHAFILGLPLNAVAPGAAPLVVFEGSHHLMREALTPILKGLSAEAHATTDLTEVYQAARARVFAQCPARPLPLGPGQSVLVHRLAIHGTAPWDTGPHDTGEARMMAYFRPLLADPRDWIGTD